MTALNWVKIFIFFCCAFVVRNGYLRIFVINFIKNCQFYDRFDKIWIIFLTIILREGIIAVEIERKLEIYLIEIEWALLVVRRIDWVCRNHRVLAL